MANEVETWADIFTPDFLTPIQWAGFYGGRRHDDYDGLRRLSLAILLNAAADVNGVRVGGSKVGRHTRHRDAALSWFADDSDTGPFSFRAICETLAIDPSNVRANLNRPRKVRTPVASKRRMALSGRASTR